MRVISKKRNSPPHTSSFAVLGKTWGVAKKHICLVHLILFFTLAFNQAIGANAAVSFIQPNRDLTFLSYSERINLVKLYIDVNLGQAALATLKPLMQGTPHYDVMLLAAQSYAELERPIESLKYYELARSLAQSDVERAIADAGVIKMQGWVHDTLPSSIVSIDAVYSEYAQAIARIKQLVNENKGNEALKNIQPMLSHSVGYDSYLLAAQAHAETENPQSALYYYELAQGLAQSAVEKTLASTGVDKMKKWLMLNQQKKKPRERTVEEIACTGIMMQAQGENTCVERIRLARQYLDSNQGQAAIKILQPLLNQQATFDIRIFAAQAYAEDNQPRLALAYYKSAYLIANKPYQLTIALFGIGKMQFWLGNYYPAMWSYERILDGPTNRLEFELATAGLTKSLAYADRPILGYRSIPCDLVFTTPEMVIAAAQATLWADQADLTKRILTKYKNITDKIPLNSNLGRDLEDAQWQTALNTNPNVLTPGVFYSQDSESYEVLRSTLDYSHYWSQEYQTSVGVEHVRYKQVLNRLNAEGVYVRQKWRPTRELTFNGKVEPTTYQLWDPLLWVANSNYRPNDYIGTQVLAQREIIETFPAFFHHITDYQYAANLFLSPLPYVRLNGSLSRLDISDTNIRNGYFMSASTVLSTVLGLNLTLQKRGYTNKFVSPYYFSPNQYSANTVILRLGSKTNSVWHYYVDGGLGNQNIGITGNPVATSPTRQFGFGFNGPISSCLILNVYYAESHQASAFLGSPDYKYQYGAVSLNVLL